MSWIPSIASLAVCFGGPCPEVQSTASGWELREAVPRQADVSFANGEVQLAGTLLLPQTRKRVPAVVFVHGAAYHEREDNRKEAEYFARHGIAALVYDKRGCGASTGDWKTASQ